MTLDISGGLTRVRRAKSDAAPAHVTAVEHDRGSSLEWYALAFYGLTTRDSIRCVSQHTKKRIYG